MSYRLTDIKTVKALLTSHGQQITKALGQNFLIDPQVPYDIVRLSGITPECGVIEIGPGIGCLTVELGSVAKKVISIEIDQGLLPILQETLTGFQNITVINNDIMKVDIHALIEKEFYAMPVFVCANLPYYITTPIIMKLLESELPIERITVMVQKEVAQRLCALPGGKEYGAITLTTKYYSRPEILFEVPAHSFFPAPKVDSAVVSFTVLKEPPVVCDKKKLFFLIKAAFSQRRKTLVNCLLSSGQYSFQKPELENILLSLGHQKNIRGETLGLEEFAALCRTLN